jgi:hypothetical protein
MTLRSLIPASAFAIAVAALGACRDFPFAPPAVPELPDGAEALMPLATYADWWQATESCSGLHGDMSRITWFDVPNRTSFLYRDARYDGYWWNTVHWIVLAGEKVSNGMIVRHEMLHELLARGDHPAEYFQGKCGAIVACTEVCRTGE